MLNKVIVMGRLTKAPVLRYTQTEIPVATFSLAVDRNYSKDKEKETDFFDVVAWRHHGEFVSKHFAKGQLVCVEGRLQRRQWEDRDGKTRYTFEIVAESAYFAGSKPNAAPENFDPFYETSAMPAAA